MRYFWSNWDTYITWLEIAGGTDIDDVCRWRQIIEIYLTVHRSVGSPLSSVICPVVSLSIFRKTNVTVLRTINSQKFVSKDFCTLNVVYLKAGYVCTFLNDHFLTIYREFKETRLDEFSEQMFTNNVPDATSKKIYGNITWSINL